MSEADAGAGPAGEAPDFEASLPGWQRHLNIFCENWIFAVLVALLIRHFLLEPFRIPTASMEPMLYGDPALSRGDFVVVDKLSTRFADPDRFDVIVFQYPVPEVDVGRPSPELAEAGDDRRKDSFPFRPLYERNFVKRCLVLPGEVFYLANGDLFLRDDDGNYAVAEKPAAIQEALWLPVYRHGVQAGYLPWLAEGEGASAIDRGGHLVLAPAGGYIRFTQPFSNFYLKPGKARVQPLGVDYDDVRPQEVEVSMLAPQFTVDRPDGTRIQGNVWHLRHDPRQATTGNGIAWRVVRLTTADYDDPRRGRELNEVMDENVGDVRIHLGVAAVTGSVSLHLTEGPGDDAPTDIRLELTPAGWRLLVDGVEAATGAGDPAGREFVLRAVDDRCRLAVDGVEQLPEGLALAAVDPQQHPLELRWEGEGLLDLSILELHRDVHYSANGFLAKQVQDYQEVVQQRDAALQANFLGKADEFDRFAVYPIRRLREQMIPRLVDEEKRARYLASMERARNSWRETEWLLPLGVSPETALRAPEDGYLMLGDNSPLSMDGRNWGWVPARNIRGRVLWVAFPFGRIRVVR